MTGRRTYCSPLPAGVRCFPAPADESAATWVPAHTTNISIASLTRCQLPVLRLGACALRSSAEASEFLTQVLCAQRLNDIRDGAITPLPKEHRSHALSSVARAAPCAARLPVPPAKNPFDRLVACFYRLSSSPSRSNPERSSRSANAATRCLHAPAQSTVCRPPHRIPDPHNSSSECARTPRGELAL